jgi:hypothetical protein
MGDTPLDDKAADEMHKHLGIEGLISSPSGPQTLDESQKRDLELQQLQIENQLLRNKYNLNDPEDTREALFREQLEDEVYYAQEFAASEEGAAHIRQGIINEWAQGEPEGRSSDEVYKETFAQRKEREYLEEKRRERGESD